jgi:hypothetical protein
MMVMRMRLQMLCELINPLGKQRYLDFGGAGVTIVHLEIRNDSALLLFIQIYTPFNLCP